LPYREKGKKSSFRGRLIHEKKKLVKDDARKKGTPPRNQKKKRYREGGEIASGLKRELNERRRYVNMGGGRGGKERGEVRRR